MKLFDHRMTPAQQVTLRAKLTRQIKDHPSPQVIDTVLEQSNRPTYYFHQHIRPELIKLANLAQVSHAAQPEDNSTITNWARISLALYGAKQYSQTRPVSATDLENSLVGVGNTLKLVNYTYIKDDPDAQKTLQKIKGVVQAYTNKKNPEKIRNLANFIIACFWDYYWPQPLPFLLADVNEDKEQKLRNTTRETMLLRSKLPIDRLDEILNQMSYCGMQCLTHLWAISQPASPENASPVQQLTSTILSLKYLSGGTTLRNIRQDNSSLLNTPTPSQFRADVSSNSPECNDKTELCTVLPRPR